MSDSMFGDRYFALRDRLTELMLGIAALARETATVLDAHPSFGQLETGLGAPLLFVICGEVNAGKSTLLNALFGHDLCRVNRLPETNRVCRYRYGHPARDVAAAPLLEDHYRPAGFLRDFTLIDTPGTNSQVKGHQEITAAFLPAADLVLVVFPIANPWGAASWDAISRMPAETLDGRLVFVIQQADQRDANDIRVILGHLADLANKRLGQVPPIFAVSAQLAYEAKCATPVAADDLLASGLPALEDFISRHICQSPARRRALDGWRGEAAAALRTVDDRIDEQSRAIHDQNRFIAQLESEIDDMREQFVARLARHLAGVAEVFQTDGVRVTRLLQRRLRALPSLGRLFTGDRTGPAMESAFIERLQAAVEAVAEQDGLAVVNACHAHWQDLGGRVRAAIGHDLQSPEPIQNVLADAKQRFIQRLSHAARQGIGDLKVRNQLDRELRRRNLALKSFVFMTLVLTIAGASCGALAIPWAPGILCGLAAMFLTGAVLTAWATRRSITREFQQRLINTCGAFASTLHADYEEALRLVFRDYAASLDHLRCHLARARLAIEPRQRRWQELFLTLKAIEQEL